MPRRWVYGVAGVAVVALVAAGVVFATRGSSGLPTAEVEQYLRDWERFDTAAMARLVATPPPEFAATVKGMQSDLQVKQAAFRAGPVRRRGRNRADAAFHARLDLSGLGPFEYDGSLALRRADGDWRVAWTPAALHPQLQPGQHFGRTRTRPARAPIIGADSSPLAADSEAVVIGVEPDRLTDRAAVDAAFQQVLGVPPGRVGALVAQPGVKPNFFVPVTTVRPDRFAQVRAQLDPLPGVFFRRSSARLGPADGFAAQTLGHVGEITAERLKDLGDAYQAGDTVGLDGLEGAFERQLAGTPSGDVHLVDAAGHAGAVLHTFTGAAGAALLTTLDPRTQRAAEDALNGVTQPAAIVAVDATTGEIRAVVSRPADQPFNRALAGVYPPGSTAKVMTTAALLAAGTTPDTPVACPPQTTAGGKVFTNFEGEAAGQIPFRQAFAISCNTAFVALAGRLPAGALTDAAALFGFADAYKLPLTTGRSQFPGPKDDTEKAAEAIGQGRVVATPLHMATVAAAVASGTWRAPRLVAGDPTTTGHPLDPAVVGPLRDLMAEVVRSGTGAPAAVPGQAIAGKTGTAEFGPGNPPATHAWFIGYRANLAFAVLVEGGGVGGRVAAPIAAKFLAAA